MLRINEIFGPTIQGEGFAAGQHCLFVRTWNCNLRCKWCDTPYTWAYNEQMAKHLTNPQVFPKEDNMREMTADNVLAGLESLWDIQRKPTLIVISGGEPLLQGRELWPLAEALDGINNDVHIETAGTMVPDWQLDQFVTQYNVSPKLEHSGNLLKKRYKADVLRWFANSARARFKYVVTSESDFSEIDEQVKRIGIPPHDVMVMPEGTTASDTIFHARKIASAALERGFGLSFRTHVLLWGNERGK